MYTCDSALRDLRTRHMACIRLVSCWYPDTLRPSYIRPSRPQTRGVARSPLSCARARQSALISTRLNRLHGCSPLVVTLQGAWSGCVAATRAILATSYYAGVAECTPVSMRCWSGGMVSGIQHSGVSGAAAYLAQRRIWHSGTAAHRATTAHPATTAQPTQRRAAGAISEDLMSQRLESGQGGWAVGRGDGGAAWAR